ncbi:hypothetical protein PHJA_002169000 [Phtheirospermum japonicum]|uniref:Uncharacterized protein n=1 Tax=Phtheirospermum japonicum TaxID=374723 RepID=A0A830CMP3_9LAMI|nr:hypothetical protein PHJA_002169000 [Phtheirospermum japonicum]
MLYAHTLFPHLDIYIDKVRGDLPYQKCKVVLEAVEFLECGPEGDVGSYVADIVSQMVQDNLPKLNHVSSSVRAPVCTQPACTHDFTCVMLHRIKRCFMSPSNPNSHPPSPSLPLPTKDHSDKDPHRSDPSTYTGENVHHQLPCASQTDPSSGSIDPIFHLVQTLPFSFLRPPRLRLNLAHFTFPSP